MVSVVIPLYNKAKHIKITLDSVLTQTYQDFEVIVVNDGSTDGSEKVVMQYNDPRIRLINQENKGVSAARNRGIAEAKGELIAFLDADDEWLPEHLTAVVRLRNKYPECGLYATAYYVVNRKGKKFVPSFYGIPQYPWEGILSNYFRIALTSDPVWTSAAAVPKKVFAICGFFPVGIKTGEDIDMWCRIALKFPIAFSTTPNAVYHQEAENRTIMNVTDLFWPVVVQTLDDALTKREFPAGIYPDDILEYKNKWLIGFATHCLLGGKRSLARRFCSLASSTKRFRRWRMRNILLSFFPSFIIRAMARLK